MLWNVSQATGILLTLVFACLFVFAAGGGLVPLVFTHCTHDASVLSLCYITECTDGSISVLVYNQSPCSEFEDVRPGHSLQRRKKKVMSKMWGRTLTTIAICKH